jgi:hypothetical protein
MKEEHQNPVESSVIDESLIVKQLSTGQFLFYILHGVGVSLGLCLLWVLEAIRNRAFRLLDRANLKARTRKASAFPPGQPRKRPLTAASR